GLVEVPGRTQALRAEVVHVEPRVDESTGAREVRLRFLDPLDVAPAGQTVSVNLIVERRADAIAIPRAAILSPETNPRVRAIGDDGRVAERPIRFIDWPAVEVIVTSGLEPGMRVLADPAAAAPGTRQLPARQALAIRGQDRAAPPARDARAEPAAGTRSRHRCRRVRVHERADRRARHAADAAHGRQHCPHHAGDVRPRSRPDRARRTGAGRGAEGPQPARADPGLATGGGA